MRVQSALANIPIWTEQTTRAKPPWLSTVCWNRRVFARSALVFDDNGEKKYFKFVYATQNPYLVCCSPLRPVLDFHVRMEEVHKGNWEDLAATAWRHRFSIDFMDCCFWQDLPVVPLESMQVLPELLHIGGEEVASDSDLVPYSTFVEGLPDTEAAATSTSSSAKVVRAPSANQDLVSKYPWLQRHMDSQGRAKGHARSQAGKLPIQEEPLPEDADGDVAVQAVFDELHKMREEWQVGVAGEVSDFVVSLIGGPWSQKRFGKAYHCFRSSARRGAPEAWCVEYGLTKTASFEISLYGDRLAALLGKAWCHRLQYFYDIYLQSTEVRCRYTHADVEAYEPPADFVEAMGTLQGRQRARATQVNSTLPQMQ